MALDISQLTKSSYDYVEFALAICLAVISVLHINDDFIIFKVSFAVVIALMTLVVVFFCVAIKKNHNNLSYISIALSGFLCSLASFNISITFFVFMSLVLHFYDYSFIKLLKLIGLALLSVLIGFIITKTELITAIKLNHFCTHFFALFPFLLLAVRLDLLFAQHTQLTNDNASIQGRINSMAMAIRNLSRFVPIQLWTPIIKNNQAITVHNKRTHLTVFFSDIAGFTNMSDTLNAYDLADILNTYMDAMTKVANKHGALLDKFMGDGLLCFFGAPTSDGEASDAKKCVQMAIDMQKEMRLLRNQWKLKGFDEICIRIGINSGYCHVGNFGGKSRMSYTVLGKEANFASRLEAAAKPNEILISESTLNLVKDHFRCEKAGSLLIKGFEGATTCWRVVM